MRKKKAKIVRNSKQNEFESHVPDKILIREAVTHLKRAYRMFPQDKRSIDHPSRLLIMLSIHTLERKL